MNINIDWKKVPTAVDYIIAQLELHGYEAYLVGGAVRSLLLKQEPSDYDITTNALPREIKEVFRDARCIEIGIKHGTVTVGIDNGFVEITTYRIDGEYIDGRRPESVEYTSDIIKDLSRRDFTINAIAYSPTRGLVDPFNGVSDIKKKLIRCVGDSHRRFEEDALRIARMARFAIVLDFKIEIETKKTAYSMLDNLDKISQERKTAEVNKMIESGNIFQGMKRYHKIICRLMKISDKQYKNKLYVFRKNTRWRQPPTSFTMSNSIIAFLAFIGYQIFSIGSSDYTTNHYPEIKQWLKDLRYSNKYYTRIANIVWTLDHMINRYYYKQSKKSKRLRVFIATCPDYKESWQDIIDAFSYYISIQCDSIEELSCEVNEMNDFFQSVLNTGIPLQVSDLHITGKDLINIGIKEGKIIGYILENLLWFLNEFDLPNTTENYFGFIVSHYTQYITRDILKSDTVIRGLLNVIQHTSEYYEENIQL